MNASGSRFTMPLFQMFFSFKVLGINVELFVFLIYGKILVCYSKQVFTGKRCVCCLDAVF